MLCSSASSPALATGLVLMAYAPLSCSSSTIWSLLAACCFFTFSSDGTCTSIAIRFRGICIMKMISSTSRMSIMGTTFGSALKALVSSGSLIDMLFLPSEQGAGFLGRLGHRRHPPDPRLAGDLDRLFDLRIGRLHVRLEIQDLVRRPGRVQLPQLGFQGVLGDL